MSGNEVLAMFGAFCLVVAANHLAMLIWNYQPEPPNARKSKINTEVFKTYKHRKKDRDDDEPGS